MNRLFWLFIFFAAVAFGAEQGAAPRVVFMIGEDEYKTRETVPEFARAELEPRGVRVTVIHADKVATNSFPGVIDALRDADLLFLSVRRRTPPKDQLDAVRAFLDTGKPLIGIRTASHAFALRAKAPNVLPPLSTWAGFDPEVFGGNYTGHHGAGPKTTVSVSPAAARSPLLDGIDVSGWEGNGSLYQVSPIHESCTPLLVGTIPGKPPEPVAWTRLHGPKQARIFYTSFGHPDDFKEPKFRRLLLNAVSWAVQKPLKPVEK